MKTLMLVRHARALEAASDRERPLSDHGRHDATAMGRRLDERGRAPDLVVSSPALRALTTAHLVADELGHDRAAVVLDERLYGCDDAELLGIIRGLDDRFEQVMLFGHNPAFGELSHRLAREIAGMPPCAVCGFRYDIPSWRDLGDGPPEQAWQETPQG